MLIFIGIPAIFLWLSRRDWASYGVAMAQWQIDLDIGVKAYLIRIIPVACLMGALALGWGYTSLRGGLLVAFGEAVAIGVLLVVLRKVDHEKAVAGWRSNLFIILALLILPIFVAILRGQLSLIIISTVVWQFFFSGFGEEFVWRGYVQSRLNQVFGRPWRLFGITLGPGWVVASLLFGLTHAFNTFDPADGIYEIAWGWALFTTFSGLMFGLLREKTGSLLACGLAHGLPDAVGEALGSILGWI